MGIKVGDAYTTKSKTRTFKILGRRSKDVDKFPYIGECIKTGFVTYFSFEGEHKLEPKYNLETDTHKYIGVFPDGTLSGDTFLSREDIHGALYLGYLRAWEGDVKNVAYITYGAFNG